MASTKQQITCKDRLAMLFCGCLTINNQKLFTTDGCSCCHERELVHIPPMIEMAGTWIGKDPLPIWFIVVRIICTLLMIYMFILTIVWYCLESDPKYIFIYFTTWTNTLGMLSMIMKTITSCKAYNISKTEPNSLHKLITPQDASWKLYVGNSILVQVTVNAVGMVCMKLSIFIHRENA